MEYIIALREPFGARLDDPADSPPLERLAELEARHVVGLVVVHANSHRWVE
jgi:hypothetical protein